MSALPHAPRPMFRNTKWIFRTRRFQQSPKIRSSKLVRNLLSLYGLIYVLCRKTQGFITGRLRMSRGIWKTNTWALPASSPLLLTTCAVTAAPKPRNVHEVYAKPSHAFRIVFFHSKRPCEWQADSRAPAETLQVLFAVFCSLTAARHAWPTHAFAQTWNSHRTCHFVL